MVILAVYLISVVMSYFLIRSTIKAGYKSADVFEVFIIFIPIINLFLSFIAFHVWILSDQTRGLTRKFFRVKEGD